MDAHAPKPPSFYLVWSPQGTTPPSCRHLSQASADTEAKRLAKTNPGKQFYVLLALTVSEKPEVVTRELDTASALIPF